MVQYGKEKVKRHLDNDGSFVETEKAYSDGELVGTVHRRFEIRERVRSQAEEHEAYLKFSDGLDDTKLDPSIRIDKGPLKRGKDFYYVVKCWTTVEK